MVFIVLVNMAAASGSINEESIVFILSKLE